jgi:hypothetical protein
MDDNDTVRDQQARGHVRRGRRMIVSATLLGSGLLAGGILAGSHIAGAATTGSTSAASSSASATATTGRPDPATMSHGPGETLLTGTTAQKVTAAAKSAVPGGTIIRVETDSEGSAYEAHVRKADGSIVTVKMDKSFQVTSTISGFGAGPRSGPSGGGA